LLSVLGLLLPDGISGMLWSSWCFEWLPIEEYKNWRTTRQGKTVLTLHFSWLSKLQTHIEPHEQVLCWAFSCAISFLSG
jgi:hypothetical protein